METKRTKPWKHSQYFQGFFFFYGEVNRFGLVTAYLSRQAICKCNRQLHLPTRRLKKIKNYIQMKAPPSCHQYGDGNKYSIAVFDKKHNLIIYKN